MIFSRLDKDNKSPIDYAVEKHSEDLVRCLLIARSSICQKRAKGFSTSPHVPGSSILHMAIHDGWVDAVKAIVRAALVDKKSARSSSPSTWTAMFSQSDESGRLPIHTAAEKGDPVVFFSLLLWHQCFDKVWPRDKDASTPLDLAVSSEGYVASCLAIDYVTALQDEAREDARSWFNVGTRDLSSSMNLYQTALAYLGPGSELLSEERLNTIYYGHKAKGRDWLGPMRPCRPDPDPNQMVLHYAIMHGSVECISALLEREGDGNVGTLLDGHPLHNALGIALDGDEMIVDLMKEGGGRARVLKLLLECLGDDVKASVVEKAMLGRSVMQLACKKGVRSRQHSPHL